MPFDWRNPVGYSVVVSLQYFMTVWIGCFVGSIATLGVSSYLIGVAVADDIKGHLYAINDNAKTKRTRLTAVEQFSDFIENHTFVKQLSAGYDHYHRCVDATKILISDFSFACRIFTSVSNISQPIFMVFFTTILVIIVGIMVMIQSKIVEYPLITFHISAVTRSAMDSFCPDSLSVRL